MLREKIDKVSFVLQSEGIVALGRRILQTVSKEVQRELISLKKNGRRFICPCCYYRGPFLTARGQRNAECPKCGALARHRILKLVLSELISDGRPAFTSVLHVSPEEGIQKWLCDHSQRYASIDLASGFYRDSYQNQLSLISDLRDLPFRDREFDLVVASHVLEHVKEDERVVREVHRVLAWEGIALLPVPIVAGTQTLEYDAPHPREHYHVRAPGLDYFDRYRQAGFNVVVRSSQDFPEQYQVYDWEDRSKWPNGERPLLPKQIGERHPSYLPICRKVKKV
jgi:predicted SAM-dependent methyltransferase/RNase P subunit RPR2